MASDAQRQELHYNRGYSRLQTLMSELSSPAETSPLRVAGFHSDPDPDVLRACADDFDAAARLDPNDATAWSQKGLVAQLLGQFEPAALAWERAAELTPDIELSATCRDNAQQCRARLT